MVDAFERVIQVPAVKRESRDVECRDEMPVNDPYRTQLNTNRRKQMNNDNSTRKQKLNRIKRSLALGLALPSLLVFSLSTQAQTSKFSKSKVTTFGTAKVVSPSKANSRLKVGKPSSGIRSSISKKPSVVGSRTSRSNSSRVSSKPPQKQGSSSSLIRSLGDLRSGATIRDFGQSSNRGTPSLGSPNRGTPSLGSPNRGAPSLGSPNRGAPSLGPPNRGAPSNPGGRGLVPDNDRAGTGSLGTLPGRGNGIPSPPRFGLDIGRGRITIPGFQSPERLPFPRLDGPVTILPGDGNGRSVRPPRPDLGRVLPDRNEGLPNVVKPDPSPSITESNRIFDNILGSISAVKPNPLNIKDLGKELSKVTLPTKDKPELNVKRQEMVLGARKTMIRRCGVGAGCHWWADLLCGWHWHRHGCHWTDLCAVPGYWSCWRPCHYRVVWCPTVHGHVRTAWYFGIESFLIPDVHALGVHEVSPYSPAAMAGLQPGDMILSVNGYAFDNESILPQMIQTSGGILDLEVYREGMESPMVVQVRLRRLRITTH